MTAGFTNRKAEWESHDDWQLADRDAERKFFYNAGIEDSVASIEIGTFEDWAEKQDFSLVSPEAYYAELAWSAVLKRLGIKENTK